MTGKVWIGGRRQNFQEMLGRNLVQMDYRWNRGEMLAGRNRNWIDCEMRRGQWGKEY